MDRVNRLVYFAKLCVKINRRSTLAWRIGFNAELRKGSQRWKRLRTQLVFNILCEPLRLCVKINRRSTIVWRIGFKAELRGGSQRWKRVSTQLVFNKLCETLRLCVKKNCL